MMDLQMLASAKVGGAKFFSPRRTKPAVWQRECHQISFQGGRFGKAATAIANGHQERSNQTHRAAFPFSERLAAFPDASISAAI